MADANYSAQSPPAQNFPVQNQPMPVVLQGLHNHFDARFNQFQDDMTNRIIAGNSNNVARVQNSSIKDPRVPLSPLFHPITGDLIPNFPFTLDDLEQLDHARVSDLLMVLGYNPPQNPHAAMLLLKSAAGLRAH